VHQPAIQANPHPRVRDLTHVVPAVRKKLLLKAAPHRNVEEFQNQLLAMPASIAKRRGPRSVLRVLALPSTSNRAFRPGACSCALKSLPADELQCDGNKPCKRCATRVETSDCIYEIHIKHAKEELVKQIKELRAKDHMTEQILQALSTNEKVPEILERLRNGETYDGIVEWLGRSPMADFETLSPRESHHSTYEPSDHEMSGVAASKPFWTNVTTETSILDHLFQLYFAWIHPVHTLFSEGRFADSYGRHSETYCSSVLVNSICALACSLHSTLDGDEVDYERLGTEFSEAARQSLQPDDTRLTTIQAFAVMHLVDCARGNALRATAYLKISTLSLPRASYQENDGFAESWKATVRGVRNLNMLVHTCFIRPDPPNDPSEWAQMTFQVPPIVESATDDSTEEADNNLDNGNWYPYKHAKEQPEPRRSLLATTNREKSKLNVILQDIATIIYSQRGSPVSARQFLYQYGRLRTWREELPDELADFEDSTRYALPHVLYLL